MPIATGTVLQSEALNHLPWLIHGFSTRSGGSSSCYGGKTLNLGFTKEDSRASVEKNRREFLFAVGAGNEKRPWPLVALKQIHSDAIYAVQSADTDLLAGDGLVTNAGQIVLAIQTADCFPILLVDSKNKAVGAFHAGWRGTAKRIVEKGLGIMRRTFGTDPQDVLAAIGPGIQGCCYEVGDDVRAQFESQFDYGSTLFEETYSPDPIREKYPLLFMNARAPGHGENETRFRLDLLEANRRQMLAVGVPADQISAIKECTFCGNSKFFSYRKDKGATGRMMAVIGIKNVG